MLEERLLYSQKTVKESIRTLQEELKHVSNQNKRDIIKESISEDKKLLMKINHFLEEGIDAPKVIKEEEYFIVSQPFFYIIGKEESIIVIQYAEYKVRSNGEIEGEILSTIRLF